VSAEDPGGDGFAERRRQRRDEIAKAGSATSGRAAAVYEGRLPLRVDA
jgi:hypothetical protein